MVFQLLRRHGIRSLLLPLESRTLSTSSVFSQNPPSSSSGNNAKPNAKTGGPINWTTERDKPDRAMTDLRTLVASYSMEQRHSFTEMEKEEKVIDPDIYRLVRPMREGDVMAPHHFSFQAYKKQQAAARKFKENPKDDRDIFDRLKMDPLDHYKNYRILQQFVTSMGRIKHSSVSGLRPRNQRRMAKAIRRAVGIGLLPSTHCHPEILKGLQEEDGRDMPAQRDQPGTKRGGDRYSDPGGGGGIPGAIFPS